MLHETYQLQQAKSTGHANAIAQHDQVSHNTVILMARRLSAKYEAECTVITPATNAA
jgi:hypothetical protein